MQNEPKKLYSSRTDRKLAGVCGGIAEYFNADSSVIRIATVLITIITGGTAILAYIVAALILPEKPIDPAK